MPRPGPGQVEILLPGLGLVCVYALFRWAMLVSQMKAWFSKRDDTRERVPARNNGTKRVAYNLVSGYIHLKYFLIC